MNVRYAASDFKAQKVDVREALARVVADVGHRRADRLQSQLGDLERVIRTAQRLSGDAVTPAVERWLRARVAEVDDPLRRATIAALVLDDCWRAPLPPCMLALYPAAHERLLRFLQGPRAYDPGRFASDLAMATGSSAPSGVFNVNIPSLTSRDLYQRSRHAVGAVYRECAQHGPGPAFTWFKTFSAGRLAELHIDTRNLGDFNPAGFLKTYHRLAALLAMRPDIAGICGASWLYDPQLETVSPNLSFVRETAAEGGARFVRMRTDPIQVAFALAHSPLRRGLYERGAYAPACYGMYWSRRSLMDWAKRSGGED